MNSRILVIDALAYKKNKAFGYQEYLFNLLNYFFENRNELLFHKIIVVCDSSQVVEFSIFKDYFTIVGFDVASIIKRLIVQTTFPYKLKLNTCDVILATGNYSSPIKRSKILLVIHDLLYLRKKLLPNKLFRLHRKLYIPRSVAIADAIIAISNFTRIDIVNSIKVKRSLDIFTVYNYFDFEKFENKCGNSDVILDRKYFLCVSSSAYHKNLITIFKAFELFCFNNEIVDLCIVGSLGNDELLVFYNQLNEKVKRRIHLFSNISNSKLSLLYEECEAYISATLFEGLGMPIVEAMYFNAPLILSDIEICREVTERKATFFNPYNFEELAEILRKHEKKKIDTKSFVLKKFSSARTSQKYIEILNSL